MPYCLNEIKAIIPQIPSVDEIAILFSLASYYALCNNLLFGQNIGRLMF